MISREVSDKQLARTNMLVLRRPSNSSRLSTRRSLDIVLFRTKRGLITKVCIAIRDEPSLAATAAHAVSDGSSRIVVRTRSGYYRLVGCEFTSCTHRVSLGVIIGTLERPQNGTYGTNLCKHVIDVRLHGKCALDDYTEVFHCR